MLEKVLNVSNLVDYQEGSVVSRELLKKSTGSVTIFAFDQGQGLSEHKAPFDALMHIVDGSAKIKISGKTYEVSRGEVIIAPANEPHELKAIEKFKMVLTMLKS
ncbi:cupin [Candidatus Jorgensenbacteria bacterium RIFCSPLOWO2_12_FULL_42_11]|uniref:Cupin n=1 Tax=Candidatus Jorgensenbacteria bacterium RIFCSPLOWO2_12_FULL_42_11 TaxID=1798473 RepID=A0A1F6C268_9BACT|nr:MAG: cupin [Candidatus Jorgensenbacteria bacterium RIFCSPLOWO2_12_FULL_42_11]